MMEEEEEEEGEEESFGAICARLEREERTR